MISILPTNVKEQMLYSRRNVMLRRYLLMLMAVALALSLLIIGAQWYANKQSNQLQQNLTDKQAQRKAFAATEIKVKSLQASLSLIEKLFSQKTQFSALLEDLAKVLPAGTYLNNISLTGDEKNPVDVSIAASSLTRAGLVHNALLQSPRIATADIENIAKDEQAGKYIVKLIIAFAEGQAR